MKSIAVLHYRMMISSQSLSLNSIHFYVFHLLHVQKLNLICANIFFVSTSFIEFFFFLCLLFETGYVVDSSVCIHYRWSSNILIRARWNVFFSFDKTGRSDDNFRSTSLFRSTEKNQVTSDKKTISLIYSSLITDLLDFPAIASLLY